MKGFPENPTFAFALQLHAFDSVVRFPCTAKTRYGHGPHSAWRRWSQCTGRHADAGRGKTRPTGNEHLEAKNGSTSRGRQGKLELKIMPGRQACQIELNLEAKMLGYPPLAETGSTPVTRTGWRWAFASLHFSFASAARFLNGISPPKTGRLVR